MSCDHVAVDRAADDSGSFPGLDDDGSSKAEESGSTELERLLVDRRWSEALDLLRNGSADPAAAACRLGTGGRRPLHVAAARGAPLSVVRALLDADPAGPAEAASASDDEGNLPLHAAAGARPPMCPPAVSCLLDAFPAAAAAPNSDGELPLHVACLEECSSVPIVRLLLEAHPEGAEVADDDGNLPLHWIFHPGLDDEMLRAVLDGNPAAVEARNDHGSLPLHRACVADAPVDAVRILLERFPDGAAAPDGDGNLPSHLVSRKGGPLGGAAGPGGEPPSYLDLPEGVNAPSCRRVEGVEGGGCPDGASTTTTQEGVLRALLSIDPAVASATNDFGELPLHRACAEEAPVGVVSALLDAYPEGATTAIMRLVDKIEPNGESSSSGRGTLPLHLACSYDAPLSVVQALVEEHPKGAATVDGDGFLPLHCAVRNNAPTGVVCAVLDAYPEGASVAVGGDDYGVARGSVNGRGMLPLHYACVLRSALEVVQALLRVHPNGARQVAPDGSLPVHLAARSNAGVDVVRALLGEYPEAAEVPDADDGSRPKEYVQDKEKGCGGVQEKDAISNLDMIEEGEGDDSA